MSSGEQQETRIDLLIEKYTRLSRVFFLIAGLFVLIGSVGLFILNVDLTDRIKELQKLLPSPSSSMPPKDNFELEKDLITRIDSFYYLGMAAFLTLILCSIVLFTFKRRAMASIVYAFSSSTTLTFLIFSLELLDKIVGIRISNQYLPDIIAGVVAIAFILNPLLNTYLKKLFSPKEEYSRAKQNQD